jgi:hypothetical protein
MDEPTASRLSRKILFYALVCLIAGLFIVSIIPKPLHSGPTSKNTCINNLRQIDGAKEQWALEHGKTNSDIPTWADIKPYFGRPGIDLPTCPSGGKYTLGAMSNLPTCSVPGHVLP